MHSRRIVGAAMLGLVVAAGAISPTRAATPSLAPASNGSMTSGERPLTADEQALSRAKVAGAEQFVSRLRAAGFGLVSLACVPNSTPPSGMPTSPQTAALKPPTPNAGCAPPSGFLSVAARQQIRNYYCGPAVGQVISNYAWAMKSGADKFSQTTIAGWMRTDVNGQTIAPDLASGLNRATAGSPRHKQSFTWTVTVLQDLDRDGTTSDELQTYLMSAISSVKMPIAFSVKPHDPASSLHLASWPKPAGTSGHWLTAYGWSGTGGTSARTYYVDSSAGLGSGTGAYWNRTVDIANLIDAHTRRIVW